MEMLMKPQLCVSSNATDDYLRYLRQMNISHCFVMFRNEGDELRRGQPDAGARSGGRADGG